MEKVITRFAPSPTGPLHIGGARTALFNWLYAKKKGGLFKLRIEDTDRVRSKDKFTKEICDAMLWLNIKWDDDIVFQSKNIEYHVSLAEKLLKEGKAYKCYTTKEEIEKAKKNAKKKKKPYKYDRKWREYQGTLDKPYVVRVKIPLDESTVLNDGILGEIKINNNELDDFIILRTDKTPTYMLSVVADDKLMEVTDVIRGDDHLTNTFKQLILYRLFKWLPPRYNHIPLIHSKEGSKLSKRHGDLSVTSYQLKKYIPEAVNNYLLRLGWGHKDKEFFSMSEAKNLFSLKGVGKAPAKFDQKKLDFLNTHYIRTLELHDIKKMLKLGDINKKIEKNKILEKVIDLFRERAESLNDIECGLKYMFNDNYFITVDAKALVDNANLDIVCTAIKRLECISQWSSDAIREKIKSLSTEKKVKLFDIAAPIRASLTGQQFSPNIFILIEYLGKDVTIKRLKKSFCK